MRRRFLCVLLFTFGTLPALVNPLQAQPAGPLVAVGGRSTGEEIVARTLELAGGSGAVVAVLPQSSAVGDAGDGSVQMWLKAGARESFKVGFGDAEAARRALERATLIWMPGVSQSRFMDAISGTGLDDVIRARHRSGATVGGTSAGAALLSKVMITATPSCTAFPRKNRDTRRSRTVAGSHRRSVFPAASAVVGRSVDT